jgi:hypothetical protein
VVRKFGSGVAQQRMRARQTLAQAGSLASGAAIGSNGADGGQRLGLRLVEPLGPLPVRAEGGDQPGGAGQRVGWRGHGGPAIRSRRSRTASGKARMPVGVR